VFRGDSDYGAEIDVYSYGVIMWEIATRDTPWDELGNDLSHAELFRRLNVALQTGKRPTVPDNVAANYPDYVVCLRSCWAGDPADRPDFSNVVEQLAMCLRHVTSNSPPTPGPVANGWALVAPFK